MDEKRREELTQTVIQHLRGADPRGLRELFDDSQVADIAEVLEELDDGAKEAVFALLDNEQAGAILGEVELEAQAFLLKALGSSRTSDILDAMPSDDAADILLELPEERTQALLDLMEEERAREVRELLAYDERTAGGIMAREYVAIEQGVDVRRTIDELRRTAPDAETIYYVYVVDRDERLVGVISLRELIIADPATRIQDIMRETVVQVSVDMDREEVARVVARYDFLAVPVVDREQRLVGIVTVDDVLDVIEEEATEDIIRLSGTSPVEGAEYMRARPLTAARYRLPWLLVTMVGGILASRVIGQYEATLSAVVALAFFIPLVMGMGGNVGTQSSSIAVRGIALGELTAENIVRTIMREAAIGFLLGISCGVAAALLAGLWLHTLVLGVVVGLAMSANMTTAATMGTLIPYSLGKLGFDPAVASAPIITTILDVTGLFIYFGLAVFFFREVLL